MKMETKTQHTAGPWICDDYYNPGSSPEIRMNGIRIARMCSAAIGKGQTQRQQEQKANAEFIVRACNSHDALLEACKAIKQAIEDTDKDGLIRDDFIFAQAEAAIALAEPAEKGE
jgi:hypothetical protein